SSPPTPRAPATATAATRGLPLTPGDGLQTQARRDLRKTASTTAQPSIDRPASVKRSAVVPHVGPPRSRATWSSVVVYQMPRLAPPAKMLYLVATAPRPMVSRTKLVKAASATPAKKL